MYQANCGATFYYLIAEQVGAIFQITHLNAALSSIYPPQCRAWVLNLCARRFQSQIYTSKFLDTCHSCQKCTRVCKINRFGLVLSPCNTGNCEQLESEQAGAADTLSAVQQPLERSHPTQSTSTRVNAACSPRLSAVSMTLAANYFHGKKRPFADPCRRQEQFTGPAQCKCHQPLATNRTFFGAHMQPLIRCL